MSRPSEKRGWRKARTGLRALALFLGTTSMPLLSAWGETPAPAENSFLIPASVTDRVAAPLLPQTPAPVKPAPSTPPELAAAPGQDFAPADGGQIQQVQVLPNGPVTGPTGGNAGLPNPDGDIEFQRGILKFPNGPLAGRRAMRAAEGGPLGWAGTVQHVPSDAPAGSDFFSIEDRWRAAFPNWDRWIFGLPIDSYHQNVLKGDYPICGTQDIFFNITGVSDTFGESREVQIKGGDQYQSQFIQTFAATLNLFKGNNSFYPSDWFLQITPFWQLRDQSFDNTHNFFAIQDAFVDVKLAILTDFYDQMNIRIGRQAFNFDFRGFLFNDTNDAIRLFANDEENRIQWNVFAFDLRAKDQVTQLNTFDSREEQLVGANIFRQDPGDLWGTGRFLGLTVEAGVLYNHDELLQGVNDVYLELAMDGRIGRVNVDAAFIQEFGHDDDNPFVHHSVDINAQMAECELVLPLDWFFPKVSVLYSSGDHNVGGHTATGFDGVFDNPNFAGGAFSFFDREAQNPGGFALKNQFTFYPDLRNKFAQSSNSVNPGLLLLNAGFAANISTRAQLQMNYNYYQLDDPSSLEFVVAGGNVAKMQSLSRELGSEINLGLVYKPLIIDNAQFTLGTSALFPGGTLVQLGKSADTLYTLFLDWTMFY